MSADPRGAGLPLVAVADRIIEVRGERVILDEDLARIYGVETRVLNQAMSRNPERFPKDFAFRLTPPEYADLRSQSVTSSSGHGGRRKLPWAFTEHGAIMAASVLNSPRAGEATSLLRSRSQSVTLKRGQNVKYQPWALTEHGGIMAASVLNSPRAVEGGRYPHEGHEVFGARYRGAGRGR